MFEYYYDQRDETALLTQLLRNWYLALDIMSPRCFGSQEARLNQNLRSDGQFAIQRGGFRYKIPEITDCHSRFLAASPIRPMTFTVFFFCFFLSSLVTSHLARYINVVMHKITCLLHQYNTRHKNSEAIHNGFGKIFPFQSETKLTSATKSMLSRSKS